MKWAHALRLALWNCHYHETCEANLDPTYSLKPTSCKAQPRLHLPSQPEEASVNSDYISWMLQLSHRYLKEIYIILKLMCADALRVLWLIFPLTSRMTARPHGRYPCIQFQEGLLFPQKQLQSLPSMFS